ncbi:MAG: hypothetical protein VB144_03925 [Clostridia bacterium]|nr:hypothetical protein [Clostridia bacterium]
MMHTRDPQSFYLWDAFARDGSDDGTYQVRVWTNDAAGNRSASYASDTFIIDTQPPTLASGAPTGYIGTTTPTISAGFADAGVGLDASETVLTITYNGSSTDITSGFTGTPSYEDGDTSTKIEYTATSNLADGEYTVDMVAYDLAGIKSTPDPTLQWTFSVDTKPPTNPGEPVAGNMRDGGKRYTNTLRPTFSWAASTDPNADDGTPGSGVKDYRFQLGAESGKPGPLVDAWPDALVNPTGADPIPATPGANTQQWTPSSDLPLAVGVEYSGRVKAFDNVGNASAWVDPIIIYDPHEPKTPGTPATTTPTADKTPSWQWGGSTDDVSGVDVHHIQIRRQGSIDWDVFDTIVDIPDALIPADPQIWEQGLQLENGTYEIRVQAMDVAGNYSEWSGIGSVTVDALPPAVPAIKALAPGYNTSPIAINWNDVTDGTNDITYVLQIAKNAGFDGPTNEACSVSNYSFDAEAAGEGEYWFRVKTVSTLPGAGGTKESGWSPAVSTIYDKTGPDASVVTLHTASPTKESAQQWTWTTPADAVRYDFGESTDGTTAPTVFADVGNVCTCTTNFTSDGAHYVMVRAYDGLDNAAAINIGNPVVGGVASYTPAALVDGTHSLKVRALDALGNPSDWTAEAIVLVDTTPPERPNAPETTSPTREATQVWTWGAVADADLDHYEVMIDGGPPLATPTPGNANTYTTSLGEGVHFLQVRSVDDLGNTSLWSEKGYVTIDRTAPRAPVMRALPRFTNAAQLTFEWSASFDAAKYELSYSKDGGADWTQEDFAGVRSDPVDIGGVPDNATVLGKVRAYDAVGNVSLWSDEMPGAVIASTIIDRTGPVVAIASPTEPVATNAATFTWTWTAVDDGCGVNNYMISLNGGSWLLVEDGASYSGKLDEGDNKLLWWARSAAGSALAACAPGKG